MNNFTHEMYWKPIVGRIRSAPDYFYNEKTQTVHYIKTGEVAARNYPLTKKQHGWVFIPINVIEANE